jgi:UDP-glucose 4-epimerase
LNHKKTILVTGGCGYIGSHTSVSLAQAGHEILILDNLCNSNASVIDRLETLIGKRPTFIEGDIRDSALLERIFATHAIDAAMQRADVRTLVFSSSATVYGNPQTLPVSEDAPRSATNPYGQSKLMIEDILADLYRAEPGWRIARLRYFNPAGAHESGLIGENPNGMPNNLMPLIAEVAIGKRPFINIWGNDYPTPDGTGVRDYIHVVDLADGHVAALNYLNTQTSTLVTLNLGTGQGFSVMAMIKAFEATSGRRIPFKIASRRDGDVAACWANPRMAHELLDWKARRGLKEISSDTWRWAMAANC